MFYFPVHPYVLRACKFVLQDAPRMWLSVPWTHATASRRSQEWAGSTTSHLPKTRLRTGFSVHKVAFVWISVLWM